MGAEKLLMRMLVIHVLDAKIWVRRETETHMHEVTKAELMKLIDEQT